MRISAKEMLAEGYYFAGGLVWSGTEVVADLAGIASLRGCGGGRRCRVGVRATLERRARGSTARPLKQNKELELLRAAPCSPCLRGKSGENKNSARRARR